MYLLLSAVDFPFCFIAVRLLGTDRIGRWEHIVVERFWALVELPFPDIRGRAKEAVAVEEVGEAGTGYGQVKEQSNEVAVVGYDHGLVFAAFNRFRLPLSNIPPPAPKYSNDLRRKRRGQRDPDEYEAFMNRVC